MTPDAEASLFADDFLGRLERMRLQSRRVLSGALRADRRSRRTGSSLEFADHRNYASGDDPRRIDWSIYGRIERLMTKVYEEEEDLEVALLIDASPSMRWSSRRGESKWLLARRLAAALAYLGLYGLDRIGLYYFDSTLRAESGLLRGRKAFHQATQFLRQAPAEEKGHTNLLESFSRFARHKKRRGLAVVFSDCLDPAGYEKGLAALTGRRFALHLVQLVDPAEAHPGETGDLLLRDTETGAEIALTASPALLATYQKEFTAFREGLKSWCGRNAAGYSFVLADTPFEDIVLRQFRRDGLLQ